METYEVACSNCNTTTFVEPTEVGEFNINHCPICGQEDPEVEEMGNDND